MNRTDLAALVELGDLDALTARIDSLAFDDAWGDVVDLRDRCRAAVERGKQLWPAAAYAEYRMALDGPAPIAAAVLGSTSEKFAFGSYVEVIASAHTFSELCDHLAAGPARASVAHERVCRGEDVSLFVDRMRAEDPFAMPFALLPFESAYSSPVYKPGKVEEPTPSAPSFGPIQRSEAGPLRTDAPECIDALRDLVSTWTQQSNGRVEAVMVDGDASEAIAALGCRNHRLAEVSAPAAMDWMVWAGASGGAHGRRRGLGPARYGALWAMLCVAGLDDPARELRAHDLEELVSVISDLRFVLFDDGAPPLGWNLRLAIEDPLDGVSFAVSAVDARMD